MKHNKTQPTKSGRRKKGAAGTAIVNAMQLPDEREVWPGEEKLTHRISKESDQELGERKVEHSVLDQARTKPPHR